jgi:hypothetical protein
MTTDPARTECTLNDDGRLIIAVGTVAGHTAQRAGLPEEVQQCLADAVVRACRETFAVVGNNGGRPRQDSAIRVVIAGFPDRVEAVIEYSGAELPKSSLDSVLRCGAQETEGAASRPADDSRLDRVQYASLDGRSRLTLVKYRGTVKPELNDESQIRKVP